MTKVRLGRSVATFSTRTRMWISDSALAAKVLNSTLRNPEFSPGDGNIAQWAAERARELLNAEIISVDESRGRKGRVY